MKFSDFYCNTYYWRFLSYLFTIVIFFLIILDFVSKNLFSKLLSLTLLIYSAILIIYSTEKEFERWQNYYQNNRHPGEWFVIAWTAIVVFLLLTDYFSGWVYKIPDGIFESYILVITLLIITKKSKAIYYTIKK